MENKPKIMFLLLGLLVVLAAGSTALWFVLKKPSTPSKPKEQAQQPTVTGRINASGFYTAEELAHSALSSGQKENKPNYEPVLMTSQEGQRLILDRMRKIQLNKADADKVRAKHLVGRTLVDTNSFNSKALTHINKMFAQLPNVVEGDFLTYPVYGKFETEGEALRNDLKNFLSKSWDGYNLTEHRHGGDSHWLGSVELNLIYGNQNSFVHSADNIWWGVLDRDGLNFYKAINGHDVPDGRLLEKWNGKGVFNAGGAYKLAQNWLKELDFFDKVTREEAIDALEEEGLIVRTKSKKKR